MKVTTVPALGYEVVDQVATLTLNDPSTRNALGPAMRDLVAEALQAIERDRGIRAVILTGASGHFCSGGDLRNIASAGLDNQGWRERLHDLHQWFKILVTLDRPVIAAVDGAAFGAGLGLALAADYVIGTPRTRMAVSFLRIGLVPDCGVFYTLPRIVGAQRAKELMLSAREVGADEAHRLGLVAELQAPDQLMARARAIAASFVQASPSAVSLIKRAMATGDDLATRLEFEANAQALAMGTQHHRDAVGDFLAKQPARFQWPV
ncbi:MAG: enoyl-CoA hydratase/isomerase family protein [Pseudomonas sp.]|uniref:enoyl-CoA hydratase/isomerase family protein n=1 Tax=Pseudomonas sp. TaxID=306 RepID=UPI00122BBB0C|nr:enoyl-CoA hydratase/isomerase family protein [Pseudomonas sp.]RZI76768.1 MAG: enoyl-CoA hydratase/isomerase family protein [Pseudomonas sp.]